MIKTKMVLALAVATFGCVGHAEAVLLAPPVSSGLVSWYTFDNGTDKSGNGNNFSIINPTGSVTYNVEDSYAIFGSTGGLQAGSASNNSMSGAGFTISLWYYNGNATNASSMTFGRKWVSSAGTDNKSFMFHYNNGNYEVYLQSSDAKSKLVKFELNVPEKDKWTYISLVYDGADNGALKLYLAQAGGAEISGPAAFASSGYSALADDSAASYLISKLDGRLSGYAIYDRALSTTEINQLYLSGRQFDAVPEGGTLGMLGAGLGILGGLRARKVFGK